MSEILTPLPGHTSEETAYVVDDYPYGFRLRCKIRYWLEYKSKMGFRLCSQTTNPKVAGEFWNKPKKSTYNDLAVMGLNSEKHVTWTGINVYSIDQFEGFIAAYGPSFDETQKGISIAMAAAIQRYNNRKPLTMTITISGPVRIA